MALLNRLKLSVEGLRFFELGLPLDAILCAPFPVGERGFAPERLDRVAQVAGAKLGHAVRIELVIVAERVLAVAALHLLFSSNTVTGSLIMPILLALALDLGLDAWTIAAPAAFTSTLAFILVTESPTNVLPYSAGYFSIRDMAKVGIWMTLGAAVCVTAAITVVGLFGG